jgi:hypothetical protein
MRRTVRYLLFIVVTMVLSSACADSTGGGDYPIPNIINVTEARLHVNDTLIVDLELVDPLDDQEWTMESATITDLSEHSTLNVSRDPVRFRYTPVAAHVGHHFITFTVASNGMDDSMTMEVEVLPE